MGGGKTRALETMRRLLLRRDGVLPIAVTFNGDSHVMLDSWLPLKGPTPVMSVSRAYGISVAARMVSAVLGMDYRSVVERIQANLARLDLPATDCVSAIGDTVSFLVDRVNSARAQQVPPPPAVSIVVALLDESRKMDETVDSSDLAAFARMAFLNKPIVPGLSAALVISDLGFLSKALKSLSSRGVAVLELPSRLSPVRVVDEWWGRDVPARVLTAESHLVLELVAASMNNMPRALEMADDFLRSDKNVARPVDKALVRDLYENVFTKASERYQPTEPSKEILGAMMYREAVPLDDKILNAFSRSVVTNPLINFVPGSTMVPDASLVLLGALSRDPDASHAVKLIGNGIDSVIDIIPNARRLGDVLEEAGLQALRCRLVLAPEMEDMTLARLCGIGGAWITGNSKLAKRKAALEDTVNPATAAFMFAPLDLKGWKYDGAVDRLSACSQGTKKSEADFLADLDALEVNVSRPVRLIRPMEGESWDLCVKALNPATGEAFLVFFDDKSSTEFDEGKTPLTLNEVTDHQKQYNRTKAVLGPSRPFLYVYRSTYVPSQVLPAANRAEDALPSRCLVLGREDTLSLLGPFAEIYQAACAAVGYKFGNRGEAKSQP